MGCTNKGREKHRDNERRKGSDNKQVNTKGEREEKERGSEVSHITYSWMLLSSLLSFIDLPSLLSFINLPSLLSFIVLFQRGVCGSGIQERNVSCVGEDGLPVNSTRCPHDTEKLILKVRPAS